MVAKKFEDEVVKNENIDLNNEFFTLIKKLNVFDNISAELQSQENFL